MDLQLIKQNEWLMERHRHINVDHEDWWEYTYNEFTDRMKQKGIHVEKMYFNGFWSQGDGACFEGSINDHKVFLEEHFTRDEYPMVYKLVENKGIFSLACTHRGHYYHENSVVFDEDYDILSYVLDRPTDFHEQVVANLEEQLDDEMKLFWVEAKEIFRTYMRELYRELEKEYDHLTSDDEVAEAILANDLAHNLDDEGDE